MTSLLLPFLRILKHRPTLEADLIMASLSLMGCNENWIIGSEAHFRSILRSVKRLSPSFYTEWMNLLLSFEGKFIQKRAAFCLKESEAIGEVISHIGSLINHHQKYCC